MRMALGCNPECLCCSVCGSVRCSVRCSVCCILCCRVRCSVCCSACCSVCGSKCNPECSGMEIVRIGLSMLISIPGLLEWTTDEPQVNEQPMSSAATRVIQQLSCWGLQRLSIWDGIPDWFQYGVALVNRIDKNIGFLQKSPIKQTVFCKRDL